MLRRSRLAIYDTNGRFGKRFAKHETPEPTDSWGGLLTVAGRARRACVFVLWASTNRYLRLHAELGEMLGLFMTKVLEEKPDDVLTFAGEFFTQDDLQELVEAQIGDESTFGVLDGKLQDV